MADSIGQVDYGETVMVGESVKEGPVGEKAYPWRLTWVQVECNGITGVMLNAFLSGYSRFTAVKTLRNRRRKICVSHTGRKFPKSLVNLPSPVLRKHYSCGIKY